MEGLHSENQDQNVEENVFEQPTTNLFSISYLIETYGWYFLASCILLMYLYNKYFKKMLDDYLKRKSEYEYAEKYHKNPDLLQERMTAQELARLKMQEEYEIKAQEFKRKQEEREEKKKQEWLEKHGAGSHKLGTRKEDEEKKASLKKEYNPLMGSAGTGGYRAPKKSCCGKKCG